MTKKKIEEKLIQEAAKEEDENAEYCVICYTNKIKPYGQPLDESCSTGTEVS